MKEKENQVTPQSVYLARRRFVATTAALGGSAWLVNQYGLSSKKDKGQVVSQTETGAGTDTGAGTQNQQATSSPTPQSTQTPTAKKSVVTSGLDVRLASHTKSTRYTQNERDKTTPIGLATTYNNFYEFGTDKSHPSRYAHKLTLRPWSIKIDGLCHRGGVFDIDDLVGAHALEERIYRLRCVEAWSMVIPWIGFELGALLRRVEPMASAKYVAMQTVYRPDEMPQQKSLFRVIDYPYVEGLRLDEAMNPLTLVTVGMYGQRLYPQNGAPIKVVVPWKYGFKSPKSVVRITLTEQQPPTTWNLQSAREYGFYSNVYPARSHPRWQQSSERRFIKEGGLFNTKRIETLPFNGYGEEVAQMYQGMDLINRYY